MESITGNKLSFLTYDYLKVNETGIDLPDDLIPLLEKNKNHEEKIAQLNTVGYGVSKELISLNEERGQKYTYMTDNGESKQFDTRVFTMREDESILLDTHEIIAEEDSEIRLIIDYSSQGGIKKFRNSIIKILGRKGSTTKLYVIQRDSEQTTTCESIVSYIEEEANVQVYQHELGAEKLYTNYQTYLIGNRSEMKVDSIYFGYGKHELDLLYNIFHYGKESVSDLVLHGVLRDQCRKVFKSNLDFKQGAIQSTGSEEEYTTLLDDTVTNLSVPILLCHEDDVQGNHAASAGKIDSDILFYLNSRGISKEDAESLMIKSIFSPVVDALEDECMEKIVWDEINRIIQKGINQ